MKTLSEQELAMKSHGFSNFYRSLHEWDPRDGRMIDMQALFGLTGDERTLAEKVLIDSIPTDERDVLPALMEMKSERCVPILKEKIQTAGGGDAVDLALALWNIEKWPMAETVIIDVLAGRRKYYPQYDAPDSELEAMGRHDAARALTHFPTARSKRALYRALDDDNAMVRYHVRDSLNALGERV